MYGRNVMQELWKAVCSAPDYNYYDYCDYYYDDPGAYVEVMSTIFEEDEDTLSTKNSLKSFGARSRSGRTTPHGKTEKDCYVEQNTLNTATSAADSCSTECGRHCSNLHTKMYHEMPPLEDMIKLLIERHPNFLDKAGQVREPERVPLEDIAYAHLSRAKNRTTHKNERKRVESANIQERKSNLRVRQEKCTKKRSISEIHSREHQKNASREKTEIKFVKFNHATDEPKKTPKKQLRKKAPKTKTATAKNQQTLDKTPSLMSIHKGANAASIATTAIDTDTAIAIATVTFTTTSTNPIDNSNKENIAPNEGKLTNLVKKLGKNQAKSSKSSTKSKKSAESKTSSVQFKCSMCSCEFPSLDLLQSHRREHVESLKSRQSGSENSPKVKSILSEHRRMQPDNKASSRKLVTPENECKNQCKYCDKKFALVHALHVHLLYNCNKIPAVKRRKLELQEVEHLQKSHLLVIPRAAKSSVGIRKSPTITKAHKSTTSAKITRPYKK